MGRAIGYLLIDSHTGEPSEPQRPGTDPACPPGRRRADSHRRAPLLALCCLLTSAGRWGRNRVRDPGRDP